MSLQSGASHEALDDVTAHCRQQCPSCTSCKSARHSLDRFFLRGYDPFTHARRARPLTDRSLWSATQKPVRSRDRSLTRTNRCHPLRQRQTHAPTSLYTLQHISSTPVASITSARKITATATRCVAIVREERPKSLSSQTVFPTR